MKRDKEGQTFAHNWTVEQLEKTIAQCERWMERAKQFYDYQRKNRKLGKRTINKVSRRLA